MHKHGDLIAYMWEGIYATLRDAKECCDAGLISADEYLSLLDNTIAPDDRLAPMRDHALGLVESRQEYKVKLEKVSADKTDSKSSDSNNADEHD